MEREIDIEKRKKKERGVIRIAKCVYFHLTNSKQSFLVESTNLPLESIQCLL
jgi:hypothetical protein